MNSIYIVIVQWVLIKGKHKVNKTSTILLQETVKVILIFYLKLKPSDFSFLKHWKATPYKKYIEFKN